MRRNGLLRIGSEPNEPNRLGVRGGVDPSSPCMTYEPAAPHQTVRADFPHTASLDVHRASLESAGRSATGRFHRSSPCWRQSASRCTSDHAGRGRECFRAHQRATRCSTKRSSLFNVRRRARRKYCRAPRMYGLSSATRAGRLKPVRRVFRRSSSRMRRCALGATSRYSRANRHRCVCPRKTNVSCLASSTRVFSGCKVSPSRAITR
jgi:hypothetical protein